MMKDFKLKFLAIVLLSIIISSCNNDDDTTTTTAVIVPANLTIDDTTLYPEDIHINDNTVYVSGLGDGTIRTFDLTQTNPEAQLFATAEAGYSQSWGLTSNGTVVLNLLNNADFTGNPPGASKLV